MKKTLCFALVIAAGAAVACGGGAAQTHAATPGEAASAGAPAAPPHIGPEGIADPQPRKVRMVLDMTTLRDHPIGTTLGPMVVKLPQFPEALRTVVTDPVKQIDWVYMAGPSAKDTSKDVIVVHHSLAEAAIDQALDALHQKQPNIAPFDTGVAGVKATTGNVDVGPRVLLRAQPDLFAVVPPELAKPAARALAGSVVTSPVRDKETLRYWTTDPHAELAGVPESVKEVTVVVVARADGGADASVDGTCTSEEDAKKVAAGVSFIVRENNGFIVKMMTHGILDGVKVSTEGPVVHVAVPASRDQVEALLSLLGRALSSRADAAPPTPPNP
jgi:hypothetical protein